MDRATYTHARAATLAAADAAFDAARARGASIDQAVVAAKLAGEEEAAAHGCTAAELVEDIGERRDLEALGRADDLAFLRELREGSDERLEQIRRNLAFAAAPPWQRVALARTLAARLHRRR